MIFNDFKIEINCQILISKKGNSLKSEDLLQTAVDE